MTESISTWHVYQVARGWFVAAPSARAARRHFWKQKQQPELSKQFGKTRLATDEEINLELVLPDGNPAGTMRSRLLQAEFVHRPWIVCAPNFKIQLKPKAEETHGINNGSQ